MWCPPPPPPGGGGGPSFGDSPPGGGGGNRCPWGRGGGGMDRGGGVRLVVVAQLVRHRAAETGAVASIPGRHNCQLCCVPHVCPTLFSFGSATALWGWPRCLLSLHGFHVSHMYPGLLKCVSCAYPPPPKKKCVSRGGGDTHHLQVWCAASLLWPQPIATFTSIPGHHCTVPHPRDPCPPFCRLCTPICRGPDTYRGFACGSQSPVDKGCVFKVLKGSPLVTTGVPPHRCRVVGHGQ